MADAVFAFELEGDSGPALEQAAALEKLKERLQETTANLSGMRTAFNAMKGSAYANGPAFKALKDQIAAQKAALAGAHARFVELGGDFKNLKKPTQDAKTGFDEFVSKIKGSGGPLGKFTGGLENLQKLGASGVIGAGLASIGAAVVALTVAVGVATAALFKFGIAMADVVRSERLQLEGLTKVRNWYGLAADKAGFLQETISKVAGSSALGRDQINGMAVSLYRAGLRGGSLQQALEGVATATSAAGEEQGNFYKSWFIGAARSGQATKKLADDIKARFGGVARAQLLSLDVQSKKLHESFQQLFSGLKIDGFLEALHDVTDLFSQNTFSGRALKTIIEALFQPMIDFVSGNGILVKRFFQGLVIGALLLTIGILKVRNFLRAAFGDSAILKGIDKQRMAVYAGAAIFGAFAAVVISVAAAFAALAAAVLVVLSPFITLFGTIAAGYKLITSIDWGGAASALVDGFVNGITNGVQRVVKAVKGLGTAALQALRNALDIHSPSKAFMRLGVEIPRGMAKGVDAGAGNVDAAVGGMGGGALDAAPAPKPARGFGRGPTSITLIVQVEGGGQKDPRRYGEAIGEGILGKLTDVLEGVAIQLGAEVPA